MLYLDKTDTKAFQLQVGCARIDTVFLPLTSISIQTHYKAKLQTQNSLPKLKVITEVA